MQIKASDGVEADLAALESLRTQRGLTPAQRSHIEQEMRNIRVGAKTEREAARLIELYFGRSQNWVTIHDLRLEVDGVSARIDHILINRLLDVWICESKHFNDRVSINERGEWSTGSGSNVRGIPSPLEQAARQAHVLGRVFDVGLVQVPRRLGIIPIAPWIRPLVLVSNNAFIERPAVRATWIDQVLKAEQLKTHVFDEFDRHSTFALLRLVGTDSLAELGRDLASLHRPIVTNWAARFGLTA